MAFLAGLIPFVLETAASVGTVATELTGSVAAGNIARGAVVGAVGTGIEKIATSVLGANNVNYIENKVSTAVNNVDNAFNQVIGTQAFMPNQGISIHQPSNYQNSTNPFLQNAQDPRARTINMTPIPSMRYQNIGNIQNLNGNVLGDMINTPITDSGINWKPQNQPSQNQQTQQVDQQQSVSQSTPTKSNQEISYDLGTLAGVMTNKTLANPNSSNQSLADAISREFPALQYLINPIFNSTSGTTQPTDAEYNQIASVYNGKSLRTEDVVETVDAKGFKIFSIKDEKGEIQSWTTQWNTYKTVPTIYGIWTGINSRNDFKPISLLDTFAMLHDISYRKMGSFHKKSDYALLARISQNMDRMILYERPYAKIALQYFTNAGHILRYFTDNEGELGDGKGTGNTGNTTNNANTTNSVETNKLDIPQVISPTDIVPDAVMQGFIDNQSTTSSMQTLKSMVLLQKIDSLMIEIV
jgi:hypothetical protein